MGRKEEVSRTIQFWRLVDARDGRFVEDYDWESFIRGIYVAKDEPAVFALSGIEIAGKFYSHEARNLQPLTPLYGAAQLEHPFDDTSAFIAVISSSKDFTPNQKHLNTGEQRPMALAGDEWEPVDNLFVYHLPFGNMIAVLAESVSSKRAKVYAEWLNSLMFREGKFKDDPDFRWKATPVVDGDAIQKIEDATKLKSVLIAGEFGNSVNKQLPSMGGIFGPKFAKDIEGVRIEIKVSTVRGRSHEEDQEAILDWYKDNFGDFSDADGIATKARVVAERGDSVDGYSEVDLIEQRLTRKRSVALSSTGAAVINYRSAAEALLDATKLDFKTLLELRV